MDRIKSDCEEIPEMDDQAERIDRLQRLIKDVGVRQENDNPRQKPIPEKLYHVTTKENAEKIRLTGLQPEKLRLSDAEVVCLADDVNYAKFVAAITQNANLYDLVVIEIDSSCLELAEIDNLLRDADPENPDRFKSVETHELHYKLKIPPECLRFI